MAAAPLKAVWRQRVLTPSYRSRVAGQLHLFGYHKPVVVAARTKHEDRVAAQDIHRSLIRRDSCAPHSCETLCKRSVAWSRLLIRSRCEIARSGGGRRSLRPSRLIQGNRDDHRRRQGGSDSKRLSTIFHCPNLHALCEGLSARTWKKLECFGKGQSVRMGRINPALQECLADPFHPLRIPLEQIVGSRVAGMWGDEVGELEGDDLLRDRGCGFELKA